VTSLLSRLRPVPGDVATYDTPLADAAALLHTEEAAVAALAADGLPHVEDRTRGPLFDYTDLTNVAHLSGTGMTVPELAWRFLLRFAAGQPRTWFEPLTWEVTVGPPPRAAAWPYLFAVPDMSAPGVDQITQPAGLEGRPALPGYQQEPYQVLVQLSGCRAEIAAGRIRDAFDSVLDALTSGVVTYQAVAERLRPDHERAWQLGMADCVVSSKVLADQLIAGGVEARTRRGYLLGLLGSDHAWCEALVDQQWMPLDPVFAYLAVRDAAPRSAAAVARAAEFRDACCGSRFNRLLPCAVPGTAPLITGTDGEPVPLWALAGVSSRIWKGKP
jgi:hypothetical protein